MSQKDAAKRRLGEVRTQRRVAEGVVLSMQAQPREHAAVKSDPHASCPWQDLSVGHVPLVSHGGFLYARKPPEGSTGAVGFTVGVCPIVSV